MADRVYNFGAGPTALPTEVLQQVQEELLDFQGMGTSILEISHRSPEFMALLDETTALVHELGNIPKHFKVLYLQGGANMQFAAVPMNLMQRTDGPMQYVNSGNFAGRAIKEAQRYGDVEVASSSEDTGFDRIPELPHAAINPNASFLHITSNNTLFGTRWQTFPETSSVPLVADMTSELFSRVLDFEQFGLIYAAFQKNLGPSGMAIVIVNESLLGHALPTTPSILNYSTMAEANSLANTTNTFAIYILKLVLEWKKAQGGIAVLEAINAQKAELLYGLLDQSDFYQAVAHKEHRSHMNVAFHLADDSLNAEFLKQALENDLYALKGHRLVGGMRASIYNAMPLAGVKQLVSFMEDFEQRLG